MASHNNCHSQFSAFHCMLLWLFCFVFKIKIWIKIYCISLSLTYESCLAKSCLLWYVCYTNTKSIGIISILVCK